MKKQTAQYSSAISGNVTIKDIGRAMGVSHATVSRALNNSPLVPKKTREKVLKTAREMGYTPDRIARMLRGSNSNLIGFILPDVENHFYSSVAKIIAKTVAARNFQLILAISEEDPELEQRHINELLLARAHGIIITPSANLTEQSYTILNRLNTIQLVRSHKKIQADIVVPDDRLAIGMSVRHLVEAGHRNIAYIGGGSQTLSTGQDRVHGYHMAMKEAGLSKYIQAELGPPKVAFGYRATKRLLASATPVEAIVLGSSQLTLGLLEAMRENGSTIPEDISVIGYDDPDWFSYWNEGFSTIQLPIKQISKFVAETICGNPTPSSNEKLRIEKHDTGRQKFICPVKLINRGTVQDRT